MDATWLPKPVITRLLLLPTGMICCVFASVNIVRIEFERADVRVRQVDHGRHERRGLVRVAFDVLGEDVHRLAAQVPAAVPACPMLEITITDRCSDRSGCTRSR
jgi:hypothetical protein